MSCADIRTALLTARQPYHAIPPPETAAIYAIFLQPRGLLLPIRPGMDGLLYIAMAASGAQMLDHFVQSSSASELRRTLGAILRRHLGLFPGPCAVGSAEATENFVFAYDGEIILSRWMRANLLVSVVAAEVAGIQIEAELAASLQPPLNLSGWDNPQRPLIEKLRADAVRIAGETRRAAA